MNTNKIASGATYKIAAINLFRNIEIINVVIGLFSILFGIGLLVGDASPARYNFLFISYPSVFWGILLIVLGIFKFSSFIYANIHAIFKSISVLLNIFVWVYILLSITIADSTSFSPIESVFFLPVICEVWYLSGLLDTVKNNGT